MRWSGLAWFCLLGLFPCSPLWAHDLQYRVTDEQAVVATFFYLDGSAFSYQSYEIYPPGQTVPSQVGRTDASGRLAFLPDTPGQWRIKATSEDGHGVDFRAHISEQRLIGEVEQPLFERYQRLLVGVGLILGLFGLLSLFYRGKKRKVDNENAG